MDLSFYFVGLGIVLFLNDNWILMLIGSYVLIRFTDIEKCIKTPRIKSI